MSGLNQLTSILTAAATINCATVSNLSAKESPDCGVGSLVHETRSGMGDALPFDLIPRKGSGGSDAKSPLPGDGSIPVPFTPPVPLVSDAYAPKALVREDIIDFALPPRRMPDTSRLYPNIREMLSKVLNGNRRFAAHRNPHKKPPRRK